jgi:hypothetical protein
VFSATCSAHSDWSSLVPWISVGGFPLGGGVLAADDDELRCTRLPNRLWFNAREPGARGKRNDRLSLELAGRDKRRGCACAGADEVHAASALRLGEPEYGQQIARQACGLPGIVRRPVPGKVEGKGAEAELGKPRNQPLPGVEVTSLLVDEHGPPLAKHAPTLAAKDASFKRLYLEWDQSDLRLPSRGGGEDTAPDPSAQRLPQSVFVENGR